MAPRILVADDQLHMIRFLRHQLEEEGYELLQARDGHEVVDTTLREMPDLLVLDAMMPKMDGLTALRRLKREKTTRDIPVIVLTSSADELMSREAEFSGADVILTKPYSPTRLRGEIRRLVSTDRSGRLPSNRAS
ncbi:MAG TPA: response regulator [Candidatus Angelobacter sp.]|nr:response regulator [Candidatus Angelobacter sp.]